MRLGPKRSVEVPVMVFITGVFNQLNDHNHSPSLFLSSDSNFHTACRVHTHQLGAEAQGRTRQLTNPITSFLSPSSLPVQPSWDYVKSPCLFPGKLTDLNTYTHTHTLHHKGGKKLIETTLLSLHLLVFLKKWFYAFLVISSPLLPPPPPPPLSLLKCVFSRGWVASRLQQLGSFDSSFAWFSPLWPSWGKQGCLGPGRCGSELWRAGYGHR